MFCYESYSDIDEEMRAFEDSDGFADAVDAARRYIRKWYHVEGKDEERINEYENLSRIEKTGLEYLVYIEEVW